MRIYFVAVRTALLFFLAVGGAGGINVQAQDQKDASSEKKQDPKVDPEKKEQEKQPATDNPQEEKPEAEKKDKPAQDKPEVNPQEPEEEPVPASGARMRFSAGASYSLWVAPIDFDASGALITYERDSAALSGIDLFARLDLSKDWGVQADFDFSSGTELDVTVFGIGAVYRPGLLEDPWGTHGRVSLLFGTLDDADAPGDFDLGVGFEFGGGVDLSLKTAGLDGLYVNADVMARFLEFDFDADSGITSDDGEVGGFGVRFLLGVEYRF